MHLRNALSLCIAAGALAAITIIPASAQTFASFSYVGPASATYDNATGNLSGTAIPVTFNFVAGGFGPGLLQPSGGPSVGLNPIAATLSFTGHRTGDAVGTPSANQPYVVDSFSFLRTGDNANLLSGGIPAADPASLGGTVGGSTLSLTSSLPPPGTVINFNSAFVAFPSPISASLAWTFTEPSLGGIAINVNATNHNFQQDSAATFALNPAGSFTFRPTADVPEPGTVALLSSLGVCGTAFGLRRLRRRK